MNKIKIVQLRSYKKKGGLLVPISFKNQFFLSIKRIFYIYGKKNLVRVDHPHKKCLQIFIPIKGAISIIIKNLKKFKKINISSKNPVAVIVPPKNWCRIKFNANNSILMVLCDQEYSFADYIESFADFKKFILKK